MADERRLVFLLFFVLQGWKNMENTTLKLTTLPYIICVMSQLSSTVAIGTYYCRRRGGRGGRHGVVCWLGSSRGNGG